MASIPSFAMPSDTTRLIYVLLAILFYGIYLKREKLSATEVFIFFTLILLFVAYLGYVLFTFFLFKSLFHKGKRIHVAVCAAFIIVIAYLINKRG